jgi:hypothetical protein
MSGLHGSFLSSKIVVTAYQNPDWYQVKTISNAVRVLIRGWKRSSADDLSLFLSRGGLYRKQHWPDGNDKAGDCNDCHCRA